MKAPWTSTSAIVLSGKGSWRHCWPLRVGAATRSAERRAEGQRWGGTHPPILLTPPPPSPVVTSDLAFPSDTGWVNDRCVHIHDYTTVLPSRFLAARLNNSRPPRLHAHTNTQRLRPFVIYKPCLCCHYTHSDPDKSPSCDWWTDICDVSQD